MLAHQRDVSCPEAIARRPIARDRDPARTRLRIKSTAIVGSGPSLIAFGAPWLGWQGDPGDGPERVLRPVLLMSLGAGTVLYGVIEILFP